MEFGFRVKLRFRVRLLGLVLESGYCLGFRAKLRFRVRLLGLGFESGLGLGLSLGLEIGYWVWFLSQD